MVEESNDTPLPADAKPGQHARMREIYSELAEEHRRIMGLLDQLERHGSVAQLAPLLEELHALLINHFAHEQFPGGLYEALGGFGSAYHEELRALVREHCEILSALGAVLEHARLAGAAQASQLLSEVGAVVASLRAHERREHALAQRLVTAE
jgi:hypothetical protein